MIRSSTFVLATSSFRHGFLGEDWAGWLEFQLQPAARLWSPGEQRVGRHRGHDQGLAKCFSSWYEQNWNSGGAVLFFYFVNWHFLPFPGGFGFLACMAFQFYLLYGICSIWNWTRSVCFDWFCIVVAAFFELEPFYFDGFGLNALHHHAKWRLHIQNAARSNQIKLSALFVGRIELFFPSRSWKS